MHKNRSAACAAEQGVEVVEFINRNKKHSISGVTNALPKSFKLLRV
jgi:hypothetical protein